MRTGIAFLVVVVLGVAGLMYTTAWRHGDSLLAQSTNLAGNDESSASERLAIPSAPETTQTSRPERGATPSQVESRSGQASPAAEPEAEPTWYQYVDERGSIRFARSLAEVPPRYRSGAQPLEASDRLVQRADLSDPSLRAQRPSRSPAASDQVWREHPRGEVIIYTTSWCGVCTKAIAHLEARGVEYVNKDIEESRQAEREYVQKLGGRRRGVPLIDVGGQILQGYSHASLDRALDAL